MSTFVFYPKYNLVNAIKELDNTKIERSKSPRETIESILLEKKMFDTEGKSLEDMLDELKIYGEVTISSREYNWYIIYEPKVKSRIYRFENYGKELYPLVKNCLIMVYLNQA